MGLLKKIFGTGALVLTLSGCSDIDSQLGIDVDKDGKKDLVECWYDNAVFLGSWDLYLAKGNGDGTFQESEKIIHLENEPTKLHVEDLDGDNVPDISYVVFGQGKNWGSWYMYLAKGNGDGTFQEPIQIRRYKTKPN
ncbi:VCBS repeat-containing protein [Candidatus Pacearchaeota archaeon]|nr:VCBS repeat-containing protein [Candidatus Pacearchaeota archaeon]